jgi:hypothetical protein
VNRRESVLSLAGAMTAARGVVEPVGAVAEQGIADADHLAHDGDDGDLRPLAGGAEPAARGFPADRGGGAAVATYEIVR